MADKNSLKKYEVLQPFLLALMVVFGILAGRKIEQSSLPESTSIKYAPSQHRQYPGFLEEATRFIQARYIDSMDINTISESAVSAMVRQLDPFSAYLPANHQSSDSAQNLEDAFGISILRHNNVWMIGNVKPGSAAWNQKIAPGDLILSVNDSTPSSLVLQSWKNIQLNLELQAPDQKSPTRISLNRANPMEIRTVYPVTIVQPGIGYIKIRHFGDHTYDEFITAMDSLINKHQVKNLIIDLRDNAGGYLEECSRIINQLFKEKNTLLVSTQGRTVRRAEYKTDGRQLFELGKVSILINRGSASASEVFAGAVQDLDRGLIVGQPSYGKGMVQEQYMLSNGGALRLSVARFFLPSGRTLDSTINQHSKSNEFTSKNGRKIIGYPYIYPDVKIAIDSLETLPGWTAIKVKLGEEIFKLKLSQRSGTFDPKSMSVIETTILKSIGLNTKAMTTAQRLTLSREIDSEWLLAGKEYDQWLNLNLTAQPEIKAALHYLK